ncbi:uncharacterized protein LOC143317672 [Chaetodon auriga]|uniref:uncharacterized protein LOC143317672 n=1 Tax=Chaetodon auriga TaxID=39042 RepID=UPI004032A550
MEYIDVDTSVNIKDFDRFQVFLESARGSQGHEETNQIQPNTFTEEHDPTNTDKLLSLLQKKAPQILSEYEKTGVLSVPSRKLLVKTCVGDLVERCGFYPIGAEKLALAKHIITTFPSLSVKVAGTGEGFEHFYDPISHCGFLETKLRNLRRNLEQGQRRYKKRKATSDCSEPESSDALEDGRPVTREMFLDCGKAWRMVMPAT